MDDMKLVGAITSAAAAAGAGAAGTGAGSITVATITSSAPGILGVLGFTTTTTIALPVAGIAAAAVIVGAGVLKGIELVKEQSKS